MTIYSYKKYTLLNRNYHNISIIPPSFALQSIGIRSISLNSRNRLLNNNNKKKNVY